MEWVVVLVYSIYRAFEGHTGLFCRRPHWITVCQFRNSFTFNINTWLEPQVDSQTQLTLLATAHFHYFNCDTEWWSYKWMVQFARAEWWVQEFITICRIRRLGRFAVDWSHCGGVAGGYYSLAECLYKVVHVPSRQGHATGGRGESSHATRQDG